MGLHLQGFGGALQDDQLAAAWFVKAAQGGHAQGQVNLALLLLEGRGVKRNEDEAMAWLEKAATQGHNGAHNRLRDLRAKKAEGLLQEWNEREHTVGVAPKK